VRVLLQEERLTLQHLLCPLVSTSSTPLLPLMNPSTESDRCFDDWENVDGWLGSDAMGAVANSSELHYDALFSKTNLEACTQV
jgi:hypothetical protein